MEEKQLLMIPGPTPVPQSVLLAGARPMINHRGPEFKVAIEECTAGLKRVFRTKHEVFILTCAGTGGLEAAVVNMLSPGDKVLSVSIGVFGDRFAAIASTYGVNVEKLAFDMGAAADPKLIEERLKADAGKEIRAVFVTHNETSTGVTNDLRAISAVVREHGALLLVDAISSMLAMDCDMDGWRLDVVVAGSQKAFMIPPGLSFVAINDRAAEAMKTAKIPRFYFDLGKARDYLKTGETPWTPAVPLVLQLREALRLLEKEGLENCVKRHARLARATREGVKALGLKLLADERVASNAVTSVRRPDRIDVSALRKLMREKYRVVLAGGQGSLKNDIFRIGHLGLVNEGDIVAALGLLGLAMKDMGVKLDPGAGAAAALKVFGE
ncbi:MAG: alanine--glyoxylate aminotransferase family protein [Armatimonadota bacterium]